MINITSNPAQKLDYGVASTTILFSTDSTPAFQTTGTGTSGANNITLADGLGLFRGDFVCIEGAGVGGTGPMVNILGSSNLTPNSYTFITGSQSVGLGSPGVRFNVTDAVVTRYERIETRYRASKVTLTDTTTGDVYYWDTTMNDDTAVKNPGANAVSIANRGILSRSNMVGIHSSLLPLSHNFTLLCQYEYYA